MLMIVETEIEKSLTKEDFHYGAQKYCKKKKKFFLRSGKSQSLFFEGLAVTTSESLVNALHKEALEVFCIKKMFLKILPIRQENTCVEISF